MPNETLGLNKEDTRSLYRIIQEALTNIMRHAEAENVDISIKLLPDDIQMIITDDGKGFSQTEKGNGHSFGLLGMNERAYSMEAILTIESEIHTGTTIHLNIPRKVEAL